MSQVAEHRQQLELAFHEEQNAYIVGVFGLQVGGDIAGVPQKPIALLQIVV